MQLVRLVKCAIWLLLVISASVVAQQSPPAYPTRLIRIVATHAPGSQADILMRIVAEKMAARLGQPVLVENLPGAGGTIAAARVAAAQADGYTLLLAANGHAINPALNDKLPFNTRAAFTGIGLIATVPSVIVGAPNGAVTLAEFVQRARREPGRLSYASNGIGSASHLAAELFRARADITLLHVPYKSSSDAITDIVGGRVDFCIAPLGAAVPIIKQGKVQALAVTTRERAPSLPHVPTLAEAGIAGFEFDFWYALFAPANTPPGVRERLAHELGHALALPDTRDRFAAQTAVPSALALERFDAFFYNELKRYAELVTLSNVRATLH